MAELKNGLLIDSKVIQHNIPVIERGTMEINKIKAIVIHQTHGFNAKGAIVAWKQGRKIKTKKGEKIIYPGTHFVIDRGTGSVTEGKITTKYDGVDGQITQTARVDRRCDHVAKLKNKALLTGSNSLGIELVGRWTKESEYTDSSVAQITSATWLVNTFIALIKGISPESIYAHGVISNGKEPSEGFKSLEQIKKGMEKRKTTQEIDKITIYSFIPLNFIPNEMNNTIISKIVTTDSDFEYV